jgi:hypothetical protein
MGGLLVAGDPGRLTTPRIPTGRKEAAREHANSPYPKSAKPEQSAIGTVLQEAENLLQIADDVEHIALAGDMGKGLGYTGAKTRACIGDGPLGLEALSHQIEQVDAPGVGIAMFFQTQQKAIRRVRVDTHKHRLLGLENLVEGSIADARQVDTPTDGPSRFHGAAHDVVHRAQ